MIPAPRSSSSPLQSCYQLPIIDYQFSIIDHQLSIVNYQSSIMNYQLSIINYQSSIINHQSSIINHVPWGPSESHGPTGQWAHRNNGFCNILTEMGRDATKSTENRSRMICTDLRSHFHPSPTPKSTENARKWVRRLIPGTPCLILPLGLIF